MHHCNKGAFAKITCKSTTQAVAAEIVCNGSSYTVPCTPSGEVSELNFLFNSARIRVQCSLKCGTTTNHFEITGILKYVHGFQGGIMQYVHQNHNNTSEFHWPDISHIVDIYLQWYKTLVITIASVAVAVLLSYVYLTTACGRFFRVCIYILTRIFACAWRMFTCVACLSFKHVGALFTKRSITKADVKLL